MENNFLPISKEDLEKRGWHELDIILITGDAYVDHPSYGVSVIGRVLEKAGFKVGVIAQPNWRDKNDFMKLGRPKLFFGITSGNVDSMVANYTANKKPRKTDDYSPQQKNQFRPDRALIVYSNRAKEAFPDTKIVLGGIEASLRRLVHYDYWSDSVRRSILIDAKADILAYGMAEKAIVEIAKRLSQNKELYNIRGTVIVRKNFDSLENFLEIPSFEEIALDKNRFNLAFRFIYENQNPFSAKILIQKHADRFIVYFPPQLPLKTEELDEIFDLPYVRNWHPVYNKLGGIKAFETIKSSIIAHRGCVGECSFCSLYFHQGRIVQSRSHASILKEVKLITRQSYFKGTISDVGGPTANLYSAECDRWRKEGFCKDKKCLIPQKCFNLKLNYDKCLNLYGKIKNIHGIKHVFIASGFRYDLLIEKYAVKYLSELCKYYISGQMKVAPEHAADNVLEIMNKPHFKIYEKFVHKFEQINKNLKKRCFLVNYFIIAHPGTTNNDAFILKEYLRRKHIHPEQIQDFIPIPMTLSAAIYHTAKHPLTGYSIYIPKTFQERKLQRVMI
ncbi:MAG: YgiQ family radical SAM protein [Candidatus Omnitrophota bacterium]